MGRGTSKAGKASRYGGNHPIVQSLDDVVYEGFNPSDEFEKMAWVARTTGEKDPDALRKIVTAASLYSGDFYHSFHTEEGYESERNALNKLIDNPASPVYGKDTYRGIGFAKSDENLITSAIESGRWKETGITSFSADERVAEDFAGKDRGNQERVSVIITNKGHTKGMPFAHMSKAPREREVIQSSSTMKKGMKIIGHRIEVSPEGKKTYYIDVDDSK